MFSITCTFECVCGADIDFTFECFHVSDFKPHEKTGAGLQTDLSTFPSGREHIPKWYTSSALIIFYASLKFFVNKQLAIQCILFSQYTALH